MLGKRFLGRRLVLVAAMVVGGMISGVEAAASSRPFVSVQATDPLAFQPEAHPGVFTISRSDGATAALTLSFTLTGSATNGVDYAEVSTNVTLAVGQTSTNIPITPLSEPQASKYKTVVMTLRRDEVAKPPEVPSFLVGSMNRAVVYLVYNYTNVAPKVAWVTPSNGASFLSRPNLELAVNASDSNGWVAAVDFLANGQSIGAVTNGGFPSGWDQPFLMQEAHGLTLPFLPEARERQFQFVWTNIPPGDYALTAVATDNAGLQTKSDAVQITITTNLPVPKAQIVNPPKAAEFPNSAAINIYAAAGEAGGVVNTVEFLANGASLGVETNYFATQPSSRFHHGFQWLPYYFRWTNAPEGSNVLTVVATDNNGTMATSAPVTIDVTTNTFRHRRYGQ